MNELQFASDAFECQPNQVDITIHFSILDQDGNCVQVLPLTAAGLCFPYELKGVVEQIVQQLNGKIHANRQQDSTPPPGVSSEAASDHRGGGEGDEV
jgi:hypothetical protein